MTTTDVLQWVCIALLALNLIMVVVYTGRHRR